MHLDGSRIASQQEGTKLIHEKPSVPTPVSPQRDIRTHPGDRQPPPRRVRFAEQNLTPAHPDPRHKDRRRRSSRLDHADRPGPTMPGGFVAPPPDYRPSHVTDDRSSRSGRRRRRSTSCAGVSEGVIRLSRNPNSTSTWANQRLGRLFCFT